MRTGSSGAGLGNQGPLLETFLGKPDPPWGPERWGEPTRRWWGDPSGCGAGYGSWTPLPFPLPVSCIHSTNSGWLAGPFTEGLRPWAWGESPWVGILFFLQLAV